MPQLPPTAPIGDLIGFTDCETTGTSPTDHDIISLAIVLAQVTPHGLRQIDVFDTFIRPERPENATTEAMAINGLDLAALASAPTLTEALTAAVAFLAPHGRVVFGGHNVGFDLRFIDAAEQRIGVRLPRHPSLVIDTMGMVKAHLVDKGVIPRAKLTEAVAHYRIPHKAHVAVSDCVATLCVADRIAQEDPVLFRAHTVQAMWAANQLELLAYLRACQDDESARLRETPEYQAYQEAKARFEGLPLVGEVAANVAALKARADAIEQGLQRELEKASGPVVTADGGAVGYSVKREYTYNPADVRRLLPDYAKDIIKTEEKVQFGVMQSFAKAAIKAKKAPEDVLEQLKAGARCDEKKTWQCRPGKALDREAAAARLAALAREDDVTPEEDAREAPAEVDTAAHGPDVVVSGAAPAAAALNQAWNDLADDVPLPALKALAPRPDDDLPPGPTLAGAILDDIVPPLHKHHGEGRFTEDLEPLDDCIPF